MAMRFPIGQIKNAVDRYVQYTNRGRVKMFPRSYTGFDLLHVECKKHPYMWIAVDIHNSMTDSIIDLIDEGFDRCPYCLDEKKWAASRFPEGAEL